MAQHVYSTSFGRAFLTSTTTTLYTVPTGMVAILHTMTLGWATLAKVAGTTSVFANASNARIWSVDHPASSFGSDVWSGSLVLPEGEKIRAGTGATGTVFFTASGYLLSVV